ncbi:MAG: lysine--tRNA ligase [Candidatus Omnitrophica bacterium]|nr:lysine--tRNA ligase [Candidatus Omnitrophota bacterium]
MAHLKEEFAERVKKIQEQKSAGHTLYGGRFKTDGTTQGLKDEYVEGKQGAIAGRLMAIRAHGKSIFADIKDAAGRLQLYANFNVLGEEQFTFFKSLDIGDIVGVRGSLLMSRTGEITLKVESFALLAKNIRPLPEKWHGLRDIETRYRRRYVDLIVNDEARAVFKTRSTIIKRVRDMLTDKGFLEVETPMMQPIPGGAKAEPFITHHNALHTDLYLRVAPELYLKKLLVGGLEKVFEIGKNFRNEGLSIRHNPEFTMLELYQSYADYNDMMNLTEEIVTTLVKELHGTTTLPFGEVTINYKEPWKRSSFYEILKEHTGVEWRKADIVKEAKKLGIEIKKDCTEVDILDEVFDEKVQPHLTDPTFVTDYPVIMTPLAKRKEDDPDLVYRFELFIANMEIANAYSELNDPLEQRDRFEMQREALNEKDKEIDNDFLMALEYGMPSAGGLGIGIDRLVMLLTNSHSIRDVVLFPQLKPETREEIDES